MCRSVARKTPPLVLSRRAARTTKRPPMTTVPGDRRACADGAAPVCPAAVRAASKGSVTPAGGVYQGSRTSGTRLPSAFTRVGR